MTIFSKGEKTSPDECVFRFIAGGWRGERTGGKWTLERSDKFLPRGASRKQTVRNNCVAASAAAARITVPKREGRKESAGRFLTEESVGSNIFVYERGTFPLLLFSLFPTTAAATCLE